MIIKETQPFNALTFRTQSTLSDLSKHAAVARQLCKEADRVGIKADDALQWHFFGLDGRPETVFTLEVVLPGQGKDVDVREFEWKEIPAFKCLSLIHEGSWETLPQSYQKAMSYLSSNGLMMTNQIREIYTKTDAADNANNITEIQIGIN